MCPAGTGLIGGGFDSELITSGDRVVTISADGPSESTPNAWSVRAFDGHVRAFARCAP